VDGDGGGIGRGEQGAASSAPTGIYMTYNPDIHHRRSIRLGEYDYSANGAYFVTICVQGRECLFGVIAGGEMRLNDAGQMVKEVWKGLPGRFPTMVLDEFVVMPNHVHGIICIVGAPLAAPGFESDQKGRGAESKGAASSARTLGQIMRAFKSISAIGVNRLLRRQEQPLWQRNYYERIIRDEAELNAARKYVAENPMKWSEDKENPAYIR
jgi:putative transposase